MNILVFEWSNTGRSWQTKRIPCIEEQRWHVIIIITNVTCFCIISSIAVLVCPSGYSVVPHLAELVARILWVGSVKHCLDISLLSNIENNAKQQCNMSVTLTVLKLLIVVL